MNNKTTKEYQDEGIIIYKRHTPARERLDKLYFEFDIKRNESTGMEFKTRSQVVSYLKKSHRI